jgi:hypothetical protein
VHLTASKAAAGDAGVVSHTGDMTEVSISEYTCGGYYLARAAKRADYLTSELLPDQVLSASGCISDFFPGTWAIEWVSDIFEERLRQASAFLISEHDLPKVLAWTTASFSKEFGWPHTFYRLEAARKARERFVPKVPDVALFGLGLHLSHTEEFLNEARSSPHQPECAPAGQTGVFECVSSGRKITMGGDVRGFELLVSQHGLLTCSWLCNRLEKDCAYRLGIVPNRFGFIQSLDDARKCAALISRGEVGAEPGLWLPWLVVSYG